MTRYMVLRLATLAINGDGEFTDLRDQSAGVIGACFVFATREQAEAAADGMGIVAFEVPR